LFEKDIFLRNNSYYKTIRKFS